MGVLGFVILFGLLGGVAVGLQGPLASLMSEKIGTLESVFYIHLGGTIAALIPLLFYGGRNLSRWREVPWYALGAGVLGLAVIAAMSFMVPRVGVAPAVVLIVAGQLLVSVILDHYGLFGAHPRSFDSTRALGLLLVFVGVWVTVK
ncbi:MAG: DMT family transporter [Chloroflexi bacterium]|nr:DMT family transporter [Chloroflexota bacterium]